MTADDNAGGSRGSHEPNAAQEDGPAGWFDDSRNVNKIVWALVALSAVSVFAELFYHKHTHYGFQGYIGFDAFYGFVSCVLLVLAAKQLRKVVMRDEDYYD